MKGLLCITIMFLFSSCYEKSDYDIIEINPLENLNKSENISIKEILGQLDLEYTVLETDTSCLIGRNPEFYVTSDYIISMDKNRCLLFSRKSGSMIREILHKDQDDTAYRNTLRGGNVALIEETEDILFEGLKPNELLIYSLKNGTKQTLQLHGHTYTVAPIGPISFVSATRNVLGNDSHTMFLYDNEQVVDSIPNTQMFDNSENALVIFNNDDYFYRYAGVTYYKNVTNDTIFQVNMQGKHPHAVFHTEGKGVSLDMRKHVELFRQNDEILQIYSIVENKDFIFYQTRQGKQFYKLIHNKSNRTSHLIAGTGLKNDIDGVADLWPYRITKNNEYVFIMDPASLDENTLLKLGVDSERNPIIVIGKK